MTPAVELRGVSVRRDGRVVLEGASLRIEHGGLLAVVGPNGGGKSTLLRLVTGQLAPSRGSVEVLGTTPRRARSRVGVLPQHSGLDPDYPVRVRDVVAMGRLGGRRWWRRLGRSDRAAALVALERTDAAPLEARPVGGLSGGQRQRVLLARALVDDPPLVLLDEPTAALDPKSARRVYAILERIASDRTVVLATHDLAAVSSLATRVALVDRRLVGVSDRLEPSWLERLRGFPTAEAIV
ncbi:MAG TPA: ABC transporter ATP-binding protein [Sandaracinaceae bacterium LLY-WYZ-13_1]|nr:ABC transporter ATP-binding protein [Sandaracinaceae bacterium LLY-WYZ-13_1]